MTWPITFGSLLGGSQPARDFDTMFNQTAAMIQIPCSASGNNAVSLTPLINCPALTAYNELGGYRFRANGNSSSAVTAQFNSLGFLPVYHADGVTQANIGDLANGQEYVLIYSATLAGGMPGFFLEQPAVGGGATGLGGTPGGRLTLQSATPVMTSTQAAPQTIYYAPYVNQFAPIWNGSTLQQYNFCSSLSDQIGLSIAMAGAVTFPGNLPYDIFVTLNAGVPVLVAKGWSSTTVRLITLSIFGGMLTNSVTMVAQQNPSTTISVPANQATFLGTCLTTTQGTSTFTYGAAASGGGAAFFGICNYYNKVLFNTIVQDNGTSYTYTTATARQARASVGNQISYIQSDSERAASFVYSAGVLTTANAGSVAFTGIGVNSTSSFNAANTFQTAAAIALNGTNVTCLPVSSTGLTTVAAMEEGDGAHANNFDPGGGNLLMGSIWL